MPRDTDTEAWVQLATRVPRRLHRALKVYCVRHNLTQMEFIADALKEKLAKRGGRAGRRRVSG